MRNFKKVLALVLAVATVFSFTAMANAAEVAYAELTDTANITHTEAVMVLTGLGVIQGYEDKTFRAEENVTRVQMAKMVGYIMNDGDDVNDLYKNACTFADTKANWGAGYVAYCATQGIVSGKSANVFDPNANVLGVEAAKMLLCGLGYDAEVEGFTGANWDANVLKVAKKAGLLDDLSQSKMGLPLNREDAAQMIFNALVADTVEYEDKGSTLEVAGVKIVNGAKSADKVAAKKSNGSEVKYDGVADGVLQWCEEHFFDTADKEKQLRHNTASSDDFAVYSTIWTYGKDDGEDIEIAKTITLEKTFTGSVSAEEIYEITGKINEEDTIHVAIDGTAATFASIEEGGITANAINNSVGRGNKKVLADEISVYVDDKDDEGRLIQIIGKNYFVGDIIGHFEPKKATENEYIEVEGTDNELDIYAGKFETTAFTDDDIDETKVIFTYSAKAGLDADSRVQSVAKIDAVKSGVVTKLYTDADDKLVIVADGKSYTVSPNYDSFAAEAIDIDGEYDLYLDPHGNVAFAEETKSGSTDYYMVMAKAVSGDTGSLDTADDVYKVRLLGTDGKTQDFEVAKINGTKVEDISESHALWTGIVPATKASEDIKAEECNLGTIVTYTTNSKGQIELKYAAGSYIVDYDTNYYDAIDADYDDLTDIATELTPSKAGSRTAYVLITVNADDEFVYTPINGISALKTDYDKYTYFRHVVVSDKAKSSSATKTAAVAFVFADDRASVTTKTVFTTFDASFKAFKDSDGVHAYYVVNAVEGSEIKTLNVDLAVYESTLFGKDFYVASGYSVDEYGFVDKITNAESYATHYNFTNDSIEYEDGVLTINGESFVNDNVKVYIYDKDDEQFTTKTVSALKNRNINVGSEVVYVKNSISSNTTKTVVNIFASYKEIED